MQGKQEIIDALNDGLTIELTAINQYFVQSKMCMNWGLLKLGKKHYEESLGEMKHAELLIDRIIFMEGVPDIGRYGSRPGSLWRECLQRIDCFVPRTQRWRFAGTAGTYSRRF